MPMTRREFFRTGLALAGSALLPRSGFAAEGSADALPDGLPDVAHVAGGAPEDAVRAAVDAVGGISAFVKPGQSVLILGSGISGMLHLLLAKALGAGRIIMTDVDAWRLEKAEALGAEHVLDARDDIPARVKELNGGRGVDHVIVCTGAFVAFEQALQSVDRAGTIMCFATTKPGEDLSVPLNDFWRNSVKMLPSYANAPYDAEVAIELMRSGRVAVEPLITHKLPLAEAQRGFELVANAQQSIKVIIEPQA